MLRLIPKEKEYSERFNRIIKKFEESEYFKLLHECENGESKIGLVNPYHEEPTVLDHTKMVYDYVYDNYKDDKEYNILLIGALLHDIGKIKTRQYHSDKNKVTFYNHETVGIWDALEFLKDCPLDCFEKEKIINIVAFHDVYKFTHEQNIERFNIETLELLYKFSLADANGRITKIKKDFFNELLDFSKLKDLKTIDSGCPEIIALIGVPGAGKSTFTKQKFSTKDIVVSRDKVLEDFGKKKFGDLSYSEIFGRLTKENQETIDSLFLNDIRQGIKEIRTQPSRKLVVDKTNTSKKSRQALFQKIKIYSKENKEIIKTGVVFLTPLSVVKKRLEGRNSEGDKIITPVILENFVKSFRLPDRTEFDKIYYVFGDENE